MSEFLLELFSEEIPARMQVKAANNILENITKELELIGVKSSLASSFVTPRRIAIHLDGLPDELPEKIVEKKGPKTDAREEAINGFLNSVGLKKEDLSIVDGFYFAKKLEKACKIDEHLKKIVEQVLVSFTWPKSMRSAQSETRWVRPLKNILCIFAGKTLPIKFANLVANNTTFGHRFMSSKELIINSFAQYAEDLKNNFVVLSTEDRKNIIIKQIDEIAAKLGLQAVIDENLLNEVAGLVEFPKVLVGKIDPQVMHLPKEVLVTSMKVHQRYFYFENAKKEIAPYFITVANVDFEDNSLIIAGNEKVLKARLADAKYFYDKDLNMIDGESFAKLAKMTFHSKLGTMLDKTNRMMLLAEFLSENILDTEKAKKSALLCKTDLVSEMVGEFPELQGIMGGYYALKNGHDADVACAIKEHYRPIDTNDKGDISLLGAVVSIADKIDSLVGLWIAGEKPTSSKDPFALRRSALGIIKLIRFHKINISIEKLIELAFSNYEQSSKNMLQEEIINFLNERLKFYLKAEGFRHDLIMASLKDNADNINEAIVNLSNLQEYFSKDNSNNLLYNIKRIINIIADNKVEAKIDSALFSEEDHNLYKKISITNSSIQSLEMLVASIEEYFAKVMVNDKNEKIKQNRLNLLVMIVEIASRLADFSLIEG